MKKLNIKRLQGVAIFVMAALTMTADHVDERSAREVAAHWMAAQHADRLNSPVAREMRLVHVERSLSSVTAADYYVFNASDGSAFVILSGDDRAEQVLGYGDGSLDMSNLPCGLRWMLNMYKEQIEYLHAHPGLVIGNPNRSETALSLRYLPMLTSDWSQGTPYNDMCPLYEGERCVTGCIATAMAQVMYYWRYPLSSPSVSGYDLPGMPLSTLPATTFDWDSMLDLYTGSYTSQQGQAVAKLMRYCGQASRMKYGVNGSGTDVQCQLSGMRLMGYNKYAYMVQREYFTADAWNALMLADLAEGHPILYSGHGPDGGHAFVVDGYDGPQNKYHINWGWASQGNGYFALDSFTTLGYSFNNSQQMLLDIVPSTTVPTTSDYDICVDGIYYKQTANGTEAMVTCKNSSYNSYSGQVVVPERVTQGGKTLIVTSIGKDAFRNCDNLTKVTLPSTIKSIGDRAFRSCSSLINVELPEGLEIIGRQAFTNCIALDYISLPSTVRQVCDKAFLDCFGLKRVEVDDIQSWIDLQFDGRYANPLQFAHHLYVKGREVKNLVIPDGVTSIPAFRFMGMTDMTSLTLPVGLETIGSSAFAQCPSLTALELPGTVKAVGSSAFKDCSSLVSLTLPASVKRIQTTAFAGCSKLSVVSFLGTVETIETDVFKGCNALTRVDAIDIASWVRNGFKGDNANPLSIAHHLYIDGNQVTTVVIPDSVSAVGDYVFYNFSDLTKIKIGNHVSSIGAKAFALCNGLTQVTIGDRVSVIGEKAFSTCGSLKSLSIGAAVSTIGDRAFVACTALDEVVCRASQPPVGKSILLFSNATYSRAVLKVPKKSLAAYKTADIWKNFTSIIGVDLNDLLGDVNVDGEVSIADVNALINAILSGVQAIGNCDVNGDSEVSIADINALIDMILAN